MLGSMLKQISSLFVLACLTLTSAWAQSGGKVVLLGEVDGQYNGTKIYMYNNITGDQDTVLVQDGKWRIELPFTVPTRHMLASEAESKKHGGYSPFGILVEEPGVVLIKGDLTAFYTAQVTGSKAHDVLNRYAALLETGTSADKGAVAIKQALAENPNSTGSAFVLERYGKALAPEEALICYEQLSTAVQDSYYGKSAKSQIQGALLSKQGALVQDFTLPNAAGVEVSFSSLKGNYVLLDFWASWCGPCIAEFETLREVYKHYKGKAAFEILSISTDKSEAAWKGALKSQDLPWLQMHDRAGDNSVAVGRFAVTALPTTYLINPKGEIEAKNLRGEELAAYLKELFGY